MAHEIESMMFRGETPWHSLGAKIEHNMTFDEAMSAAGLNWTVSKKDMFTGAAPVPGYKAIVRDTDKSVLGVVTDGYHVLQNSEAFRPLFEALQADGRVEIETAGSLRGGRKTWMLGRIKDAQADVVAGDTVKAYLLAATSHDGSIAHTTQITGTRVVCANTLDIALRGNEARMRVWHRSNIKDTVEHVAKLVDTAQRGFSGSVEQYRKLAASGTVNPRDLEAYFRFVFEIPEETKAEESKLLPELNTLFHTGTGMNIPGMQESMWAAYNAVTEYLTHGKGGKQAGSRVESNAFGNAAKVSQRALERALEVVG
jgi:phage/plasmid-like protein (TIGR03299 family)